jgi:subtilisin-like proprotein convertase family protein
LEEPAEQEKLLVATLPDVVSVLTVTDDQEILDLNLDLNINHTWTGDLTITLESPAGTVVTVFE